MTQKQKASGAAAQVQVGQIFNNSNSTHNALDTLTIVGGMALLGFSIIGLTLWGVMLLFG